jgi:tRNA threonylcarbamoyladenosine biosynthesis protein TsaB
MELLIDTVSSPVRIGITDANRVVARDEWPADRQLAETLATRIDQLLKSNGKTFADLTHIRVHAGPTSALSASPAPRAPAGKPGGFTTLRIGIVTANALAYALGVPIRGVVGPVASLEDLLALDASERNGSPVVPVYDRPPNITPARKPRQ